MMQIRIDERVQVMQDIPELELHYSDVGTVRSTWFEPTTAYEVDFQRRQPLCCVRALLMPNQIRVETEMHR